MDSVQVRQVLADLQFEVRNYKANRNGKSWAWSCDICGDSQVNKRKARFGLAHKDNAYVVHCFNCGYSNTFVGYLKSYHPNMYERVTVDDFVNSLDMYDLNRLFTKVSNKTLGKRPVSMSKLRLMVKEETSICERLSIIMPPVISKKAEPSTIIIAIDNSFDRGT